MSKLNQINQDADLSDLIELNRDGQYKCWVTNSYACNLINKRIRKYPADTDFVKEGSEGVFEFTHKDLPFVQAVMLKFPNKWGK